MLCESLTAYLYFNIIHIQPTEKYLNIYNQIKPKAWYSYNQSSPIKSVLVDYGKKLNYVGEQGVELFDQQREELELDNFNVLYVALTRAAEQLYIISGVVSKNQDQSYPANMASFFITFFIMVGSDTVLDLFIKLCTDFL